MPWVKFGPKKQYKENGQICLVRRFIICTVQLVVKRSSSYGN